MEADGTVSEVKVAHTGDPEVIRSGIFFKGNKSFLELNDYI